MVVGFRDFPGTSGVKSRSFLVYCWHMETKPFWASKTLWINAALMLAGLADLASATPFIPSAALPYLVFAAGVVNLVLRVFFTTLPVEPPPAIGAAKSACRSWWARFLAWFKAE